MATRLLDDPELVDHGCRKALPVVTLLRQAFAYLLSALLSGLLLILALFCAGALLGVVKVGYCAVAGCLG